MQVSKLMNSEQQATGLERFELLGDLHGVDVFDLKPIEMTRMGTLDEPIMIYTLVSVVVRLSRRNISARSPHDLLHHTLRFLRVSTFILRSWPYRSAILLGESGQKS